MRMLLMQLPGVKCYVGMRSREKVFTDYVTPSLPCSLLMSWLPTAQSRPPQTDVFNASRLLLNCHDVVLSILTRPFPLETRHYVVASVQPWRLKLEKPGPESDPPKTLGVDANVQSPPLKPGLH